MPKEYEVKVSKDNLNKALDLLNSFYTNDDIDKLSYFNLIDIINDIKSGTHVKVICEA